MPRRRRRSVNCELFGWNSEMVKLPLVRLIVIRSLRQCNAFLRSDLIASYIMLAKMARMSFATLATASTGQMGSQRSNLNWPFGTKIINFWTSDKRFIFQTKHADNVKDKKQILFVYFESHFSLC